MTKAEKFIQDYTNHCSNELVGGVYHEWLTPEQARAAVEIAREEMLKEEPVSEDLKEAADVYSKVFSDIAAPYIRKDAFIAGANWQKEQFEKNRLKHCNSITNEQAELEQGFIDQHLDKHQRMPTFLDAIEYGMQKMKEQMMKEAIPLATKEGDKYKVVLVKED